MASIIRSIFKIGRDGKPTGEIDKNCLWMFSDCNNILIEARPLPDGPMYRVSPVTGTIQKPRFISSGSFVEKEDMLYTWRSIPGKYAAKHGGHDYTAYMVNMQDRIIEGISGSRRSERRGGSDIVFLCGPSVNKNAFLLERDDLVSMEEIAPFFWSWTLSGSVVLTIVELALMNSLASRHGVLLSDARHERFAKILKRDFEQIKKMLNAA